MTTTNALPFSPLRGAEVVDRLTTNDAEVGSMVRHNYSPDHPEFVAALAAAEGYAQSLLARHPR